MTNDRVRRILTEAAAYISEHGWHQGESFKGESEDFDFDWSDIAATTPPACALGGIYYASNSAPWEDMARARIMLACVIRGAGIGEGLDKTEFASSIVAEYNDRQTTTAEDVILMMKRAAEL